MQKMEKILVTEQEYLKAREIFDACQNFTCIPISEDEEILSNTILKYKIRYVIVGINKYSNALYEALPASSVIARFGVGHDNIDKAKLNQYQIICTNTPNVLDISVAEYTVGLILSASRFIVPGHIAMTYGAWAPTQGSELYGKTVAIIGAGSIGLKVAAILKNGFGMNTKLLVRSQEKKNTQKSNANVDTIHATFKETVRDADFVTIHIPATPDNLKYINKEKLDQLSDKAWLINTSRGSVLDEEALYHALKNQTIKGAALDVYTSEPYTPLAPNLDFRKLQNVLLLPHIGSNTVQACNRMAALALQNIQCASAGEFSKMNIVNPEILNKPLYAK